MSRSRAVGLSSVIHICAAAICAGSAASAFAASWTQMQGDAKHTGYAAGVVDATRIKPLWSKTIASLGLSSEVSGAVTSTDRVYVTGDQTNGTYALFAMNKGTGNVDWSKPFTTGYGATSAPSIGNGKVYVHQWGHSGISGGSSSQYPSIIGVNQSTGAIDFRTTHSGQWSSGSQPTVAGSQVFAAGGYYGGLDNYDGATGAKGWFANVNQQYGWTPAADDTNVYVYMGSASASPGPSQGTFYAFNRLTGGSAFSIINTDDQFTTYYGTVSVGSQNDAIALSYGSAGATLVSFDTAAHNVRWRAAGSYTSALAINGGSIYAAAGLSLKVLNEATGAVTNSWSVPGTATLQSNVLVTDNLIFLGTSDLTYALNRQTLAPVWTGVAGELALGDGVLLVSNSSGITAYSALVPEPAALASLGLYGLLALRRRPT